MGGGGSRCRRRPPQVRAACDAASIATVLASSARLAPLQAAAAAALAPTSAATIPAASRAPLPASDATTVPHL